MDEEEQVIATGGWSRGPLVDISIAEQAVRPPLFEITQDTVDRLLRVGQKMVDKNFVGAVKSG